MECIETTRDGSETQVVADEYLTVRKFASRLEMSRFELYRLLAEGRGPRSVRIGTRIRIHVAELEPDRVAAWGRKR